MSDCMNTVSDFTNVREAVCVNVRKIMDACRDQDCSENVPVFLTADSQQALENATSVKARSAELLLAEVEVEPLPYQEGYYCVSCQFFYRVIADAVTCGVRPVTIYGLATTCKQAMLYGGAGAAGTFTSDGTPAVQQPIGVVEAVDPINLHMKVVENETPSEERAEVQIPDWILETFGEDLVMTEQPRNVYVTVGQFSIIRLERDTQLLLPAYDYCVPEKECEATTEDDPCAMFSRIEFPMDEFFPPDTVVEEENYRSLR